MDAGQIKRTRRRVAMSQVAMSQVAMSQVAMARVAVLQHVAFDKSGLGIEERAQVADRNGGPQHRCSTFCLAGVAELLEIPIDRGGTHGKQLIAHLTAVMKTIERQFPVILQRI